MRVLNAMIFDDDDQWSLSEDGSELRIQFDFGIILTKPRMDNRDASLAHYERKKTLSQDDLLTVMRKRISICIFALFVPAKLAYIVHKGVILTKTMRMRLAPFLAMGIVFISS